MEDLGGGVGRGGGGVVFALSSLPVHKLIQRSKTLNLLEMDCLK